MTKAELEIMKKENGEIKEKLTSLENCVKGIAEVMARLQGKTVESQKEVAERRYQSFNWSNQRVIDDMWKVYQKLNAWMKCDNPDDMEDEQDEFDGDPNKALYAIADMYPELKSGQQWDREAIIALMQFNVYACAKCRGLIHPQWEPKNGADVFEHICKQVIQVAKDWLEHTGDYTIFQSGEYYLTKEFDDECGTYFRLFWAPVVSESY